MNNEALRLAAFLDSLDVRSIDRIQNCVSAAAELRRLHEVNAELVEALTKAARHIEAMMAHIEHKPEKFREYCWQQALNARSAIAKATGESNG